MKRFSLLIIAAILSTIAVKAQGPDHPKFDPKDRAAQTVNELAKQITLTPAVQDSLKVTFLQFFEDMRKERESGNHPDMKKMQEKRDLKVKSFLTDEQYKVYQKFMEEQHKKRGGPSGQGREGGMQEPPRDGER